MNSVLHGMDSILGLDEAKHLLYQMGESMGRETMRQLELENEINEWTPEVFNDVFVQGYMMKSQTNPKTLSMEDGEVVYQTRNCLYYEAAKRNPDLVCNGLDQGFHNGVMNALGAGVTGERIRCMGHDDDSCDYKIRWPRSPKARLGISNG